MRKIRIRNLRSLADTGPIDIRPLNLLVGTNSSGKSSFLRVFPMLRQSTETRTGSGLLLNEPYVDYGLFPVAVRQNADPKEVVFDFELDLPGAERMRGALLEPLSALISVVFAQRQSDERYSYLRKVDLTIGNALPERVIIEGAEDGSVTKLTVDDYCADKEAKQLRLRTGQGIVPMLRSISQDTMDGEEFVPTEGTRSAAFTETLLNHTDSIFHGRTLRETRIQILRAIRIGTPAAMLEQMGRITDNGFWNETVRRWSQDNNEFRRLRTLILGDQLPDILAMIAAEIGDFARAVQYFEPVRARVQRDYVSRDIQVETVEPDGRNVAMFLASLPAGAKKNFLEWLSKNFGFVVFPSAVGDGARVALRFREVSTGAEFNLVDMGFGYSQMLPLLVQMWSMLNVGIRSQMHGRYKVWQRYVNMPRSFIVAIEQPELHLHPALQAKLADLFVNTIRAAEGKAVQIRFIIETHSQTIINRIGQLIEAERISADKTQVLLFERGTNPENPLVSEIRHAEFDATGVLKNWPFGFFEPQIELEPKAEIQAQATSEH
jgi:predicted ATPase